MFNCYVRVLSDEKTNTIHVVVIPKYKKLIPLYKSLFEIVFGNIHNEIRTLKDFKMRTDDVAITLSFIFKEEVDINYARDRFIVALLEVLRRYTGYVA